MPLSSQTRKINDASHKTWQFNCNIIAFYNKLLHNNNHPIGLLCLMSYIYLRQRHYFRITYICLHMHMYTILTCQNRKITQNITFAQVYHIIFNMP